MILCQTFLNSGRYEKMQNLDWSMQISFLNWRTIFLDWRNKTKLVPACNFVIQLIEKKHYVANVLLAIWETSLHEYNHNYNPYRFSYKLAFFFFLSFLVLSFLWLSFLFAKESGFQEVGGLVTRNISVLSL